MGWAIPDTPQPFSTEELLAKVSVQSFPTPILAAATALKAIDGTPIRLDKRRGKVVFLLRSLQASSSLLDNRPVISSCHNTSEQSGPSRWQSAERAGVLSPLRSRVRPGASGRMLLPPFREMS